MNKVSNTKIYKDLNAFLFCYTTKIPVSIYSKSIALVCLFNIYLIKDDIFELYSKNGLISSKLSTGITGKYTPSISDITDLLSVIGMNNSQSLWIIMSVYIFSLAMILINYKVFTFAIIAYLGQLIINSSSYLASHGGDSLTTFVLFLNVLFCTKTILQKKYFEVLFSFTLRLTQIHLCIIYFFSGFGKLLGTDWFNGEAVWTVFNVYSPQLLKYVINYNIFFIFSGLLIVATEVLFPLMVYTKKPYKSLIILFALIMHTFIGIYMQLQTFALIMILLNFIAWLNYFIPLNYVNKPKITPEIKYHSH